MKVYLKRIVEDDEKGKPGYYFDLTIQGLILLSLISFSVSTIPGLSEHTRLILHYFEVFSVTVFTVEYLLRIYVADDKWGYIKSFIGVIDLLAILPFYLNRAIDLRSLRALRMVRLLRLIKIIRYKTALERYRKALSDIKSELAIFIAATVFMLYVSSVGIYYFEHEAQPEVFKSIFHSLWWSVATLTTVGYGDVYPVTLGGRIFTFFILMIGLSVVAMPAGLFASALEENADKQEELLEKVDTIYRQIEASEDEVIK